jgi:hypothetical protein
MPPTPAFFFPVWEDSHLCSRLISDIRTYYPAADVVAITDGPIADGEPFKRFCDRNGVVLVETETRLKLPKYGGLWLQRLFEEALIRTRSEILIRTEGDTRLHRAFDYFPDADIGGTLSHQIPRFPRGGCVFWRREAIERILQSGWLGDPKYKDLFYSYSRYGKWRQEGEKEDWTPILCSDRIVGDLIARLGLRLAAWDEVNVQFRGTPPYSEGFAASHPWR